MHMEDPKPKSARALSKYWIIMNNVLKSPAQNYNDDVNPNA